MKDAFELYKELWYANGYDKQSLLIEFTLKVCQEQRQICTKIFMDDYMDVEFGKKIQSAEMPELPKIKLTKASANLLKSKPNIVPIEDDHDVPPYKYPEICLGL